MFMKKFYLVLAVWLGLVSAGCSGERTFKQALSSFGFMLGVARCSSPTCARAYPHHLGEHDAKTKKLCPVCLKGFENKLGKLLQNTD